MSIFTIGNQILICHIMKVHPLLIWSTTLVCDLFNMCVRAHARVWMGLWACARVRACVCWK